MRGVRTGFEEQQLQNGWPVQIGCEFVAHRNGPRWRRDSDGFLSNCSDSVVSTKSVVSMPSDEFQSFKNSEVCG